MQSTGERSDDFAEDWTCGTGDSCSSSVAGASTCAALGVAPGHHDFKYGSVCSWGFLAPSCILHGHLDRWKSCTVARSVHRGPWAQICMACLNHGIGVAVLPCMLGCRSTSYQSKPPRSRMYSPMSLSVVPGAAQLLWTLTVTAYLAASLSVWPLKAKERAAVHRVRSALTCSRIKDKICRSC